MASAPEGPPPLLCERVELARGVAELRAFTGTLVELQPSSNATVRGLGGQAAFDRDQPFRPEARSMRQTLLFVHDGQREFTFQVVRGLPSLIGLQVGQRLTLVWAGHPEERRTTQLALHVHELDRLEPVGLSVLLVHRVMRRTHNELLFWLKRVLVIGATFFLFPAGLGPIALVILAGLGLHALFTEGPRFVKDVKVLDEKLRQLIAQARRAQAAR